MGSDDDRLRLAGAAGVRGGPGLFGRLLSYAVAGVLLVLALMFSVVVFIGLALVVLLVGVWLWWKTRALRRQLEMAEGAWRTAPGGQGGPHGAGGDVGPAEGHVIEGEVIRVGEDELPRKP